MVKVYERGRYEVRYDDQAGRYTEENFHTRKEAFCRAAKRRKAGIEVEVFEVER